jgi:hypothetical protein
MLLGLLEAVADFGANFYDTLFKRGLIHLIDVWRVVAKDFLDVEIRLDEFACLPVNGEFAAASWRVFDFDRAQARDEVAGFGGRRSHRVFTGHFEKPLMCLSS